MEKYSREIYYPKNKAKLKAKTYKWREENPEKDAVIQKRMSKKYSAMLCKLKINGCAICGYDKCTCSLDFHHSNPEDKKFGLHIRSFRHHPVEDYVAELNKCILLCRNCHGEINELERSLI